MDQACLPVSPRGSAWVVLAGEPRTSDAFTTHLRSRLGEGWRRLQGPGSKWISSLSCPNQLSAIFRQVEE